MRGAARRLLRDLAGAPLAARLGLPVLAAGAALDAAAHGWGPAAAGLADAGHLITLVGMLLVVAGLLSAGVRCRR